jgi:hypothetical protein
LRCAIAERSASDQRKLAESNGQLRCERHPDMGARQLMTNQPTMTAARFDEIVDALGFTKRGASHFLAVTERGMARSQLPWLAGMREATKRSEELIKQNET